MKRVLGVLVALSALLAFLVVLGGSARADESFFGDDEDVGVVLSGPLDFRDADVGNAITECPQAGRPTDSSPRPLDQRVLDPVEKLSNGGDDNKTNQDYACFPQDETSIAVNPTNPKNAIGGANDYRLGWGSSGFYATTDSGTHWYDGIKPFPTSANQARDHIDGGGDPSVTFDRGGTAY